MIKVNEVSDAISLVSTVFPQFIAAYTVLKTIWFRMNPGRTEADYLEYLRSASQTNIDDSAAFLVADGYVQQADGSWKKP